MQKHQDTQSAAKNISGKCRFGHECAFKHEEKNKSMEEYKMVEMEEKIKQMETVLLATTRKVLILEKEMKEIKKNNKIIEVNKKQKYMEPPKTIYKKKLPK